MIFGPTRGNPILIFEHFLRDFGFLILVIIVAIWKGPHILVENIQFLVIAFINPVFIFMKYIFTVYSIDEEKMTIDSGFFVKKTMEIPLKAITTVDLSQNLLFQIFKVYKIKADNSSQTNDTAKKAEVVLVLKKESALYVKNLLKAEEPLKLKEEAQESEELESQPSITCSLSDFFLLGLLQSKLIYLISVVSIIFGGGGYVYTLLSGQEYISQLVKKVLHIFASVGGITLIIVCFYVFSTIFSAVINAIKYYNYTVTNRANALLVEYGFFTKKSYTLMKEKISGVTIKQSILMRILGYCTLEVFIIGYGDSSEDSQKELSLLYPIAKINQVDSILEQLLPEMNFNREYHKPSKAAFRYFFFCFRMFFAIALLIGVMFNVFTGAEYKLAMLMIGGGLVFLALTVATIYMEYQNAGMNANDQVVSISTGVLTKQMIFIKTEKIESVSEQTNFFKRKRGFTNIKLGFIAPLRVANIKAKNMTYNEYEEIQKILIL